MPRQNISTEIFRQNSSNMPIQEPPRQKKKKTILLQKKNTMNGEMTIPKKMGSFAYFEKIELKTIIKELKDKGAIEKKRLIELIDICQNILSKLFLQSKEYEPNVLRLISPVVIVGDIHGQFYDLLNIFQQNGFPDQKKFLFLGDYVDRGLFCIQVITLLLVLKLKYEKNMFLLRGNHEGRVMTINFNFRLQCQKKYGIEVYEKFMDLFCKLPLCAVVDQTYFAVHGGISPEITSIKDLQKINRYVDIQNRGIICDLVWSDPSQNNFIQWESNSMRGCSYYYSKIQAKRFLKDNKIKLIIRGHEVQIQGYNYQKSNTDEKLTLTIFSAPNYCDTYKNKGAVAFINDNKISIHRFNEVSHPFILSNYMDCFEFSIPSVCQLVGKILLYILKNKRKSRKSSMIDDKILDQLNALQRIEVINKIFENKLIQNQQVLQETTEISESLAKSYQIAYEVFTRKKSQDQEQMYPDEKVISNIKERKKTHIINLKNSKKFNNNYLDEIDYESGQVFGPKLSMEKNINKKIFFQEEQGEIQGKYEEQT